MEFSWSCTTTISLSSSCSRREIFPFSSSLPALAVNTSSSKEVFLIAVPAESFFSYFSCCIVSSFAVLSFASTSLDFSWSCGTTVSLSFPCSWSTTFPLSSFPTIKFLFSLEGKLSVRLFESSLSLFCTTFSL